MATAVRGTEGRATFDALIASIRVRRDHGVFSAGRRRADVR